MKLTSVHYFVFIIIVAVGGIIGARMWQTTQPGAYDVLAQCIADSGATFYGAFWCPHCNEQKALFGNSAKLLPYEECSTPDRKDRLQICIDEEIVSYPTWKLADGTVLSGVQQLTELADATSCPLK